MSTGAANPPACSLIAAHVRLQLAGESVELLADRALWWEGALHVADVHLGKGDHFRARGLPLPPGELDDDLDRLAALLATTGAHTLRVLGDFVHGAVSAGTEARVAEWRAGLLARIQLVPGNHDRHAPQLPRSWGVEVTDPVLHIGPFSFLHAPARLPGRFTWAGHVHPTATLGTGRERMRFPAFVVEEDSGLLPAFARFSGGPVVRPAPGTRRFICADGQVMALDE